MSEPDAEQLRDRLLEQATEDGIEIYVVPRRSDISVQCPEMGATGLRLWLENNGAEVTHAKENGYVTAKPEGSQ